MSNSDKRLRIGVGAGMADDRIGPALELLRHNNLDYLVCECLAERTIARETLTRKHNSKLGFNPMLRERMEKFLPLCREEGVKLVSNMGAANPIEAAKTSYEIGRSQGWQNLKCTAVTGDDVVERIAKHPELLLTERKVKLEEILPRMASANAYLGADVVAQALSTGAHVVLTGRVADPSLFLGVAMHHHGWDESELPLLAAGTVMGHLLECSAQVTGGYFADPGKKEVPRLAELPYPFADIYADGQLFIGKQPGSGGRLDRMTCSEQALYEIHDPRAYITPDCVLDLEGLRFNEINPDRVAVHGANAKPRTCTYKVVVGFFDGWIGSGEVAYAGVNAVARAKLAVDVIKQRFQLDGGQATEFQVDLIGLTSLHGSGPHHVGHEPYEVRLRIAAHCPNKKSADLIGEHIRQLNMQGPYGAGGPVNLGSKEVIAVDSLLIPRHWVTPELTTVGGH